MLGEGQFGTVKSGVWKEESHGTHDVAIKMLKAGSDEYKKVKFLQEAAIMAQFKHSNVVSLYGVVSAGGLVSLCSHCSHSCSLLLHLLCTYMIADDCGGVVTQRGSQAAP